MRLTQQEKRRLIYSAVFDENVSFEDKVNSILPGFYNQIIRYFETFKVSQANYVVTDHTMSLEEERLLLMAEMDLIENTTPSGKNTKRWELTSLGKKILEEHFVRN